MFININGYNLTKLDSVDTVILCEEPLGFLVSLKSGRKTFAKLVSIPGVLFGDDSPFEYMIFVPRDKYSEMVQALSGTAKWRTKEELKNDEELIKSFDISLSEILEELDISFETDYMKISPFPFQKLATAWAIKEKGKHQIKGGLLADLMGLGKTIEGIATALKLKNEGKIEKCLVICPATLKTQWQQEIEKFSSASSVIIESKSGKAFESRKELYKRVQEENIFFTIINFEMLIRREVVKRVPVKGKTKTGKQKTRDVYGDFLDVEEIKKIGYDMIIIDEAHNMKNPDTLIAQAIRKLDAEYKLLMTGTPIEKELKNVFQLFDFINPKILIDKDINSFEERRKLFEKQFVVTRMNPFLKYTNELEYIGNKNAEYLRRKINPYMLRRRPEDVSDEMPEQTISNVALDFEPRQLTLFNRATNLLKAVSEELENVAKNETEKIEKLENRTNALRTMRRIICSAPGALLKSQSPIAKEIIGKSKSLPITQKEEQLLRMIEELCIENEQKVVVFTRYARVADILNERIRKLFEAHAKKTKTKAFSSFVYKGDTPIGCEKREKEPELKDKDISCFGCEFFNNCGTRTKFAWLFQNDPQTKVLVATDAGNSGVNLQSGSHLINYDLPSNFSTYLQRNGRIRRLGSKHDKVFIHNLIIKKSVDEDNFKSIQKQMKTNDQMIENRAEDLKSIKEASNGTSDVNNK